MKENEKIIQNIKEVLAKFQHKYIKNNSYGIDNFISEFFINEEDTSFIGPGSSSWYFGLPQISNGINAYREDEHKYLKNIELDIDRMSTKSVFNLNSYRLMELISEMNKEIFKSDSISISGALNLNVKNKEAEIAFNKI